jgi:hypothetical protein
MKTKKKRSALLFYTVIVVAIIIISLNVQALTKTRITIAPIELKQNPNVNIKKEPLVLWSSDFHIATIADVKHFLSNKNVKIIDKVRLFQNFTFNYYHLHLFN